MNKLCKQCGRYIDIESFRKYYKRGEDKRKSSQGHNTICKECETLNASLTRMWRKEDPTPEELRTLETGREYYKRLVEQGLNPIGAYCGHVLGTAAQPRSTVETTMALMNGGSLMGDFERLLEMEFTEEPDVYEEMQNELMERAEVTGGGGVAPVYREINSKITEKWSNYEDQYEW